jgi:hypothetical protein
MNNEHKVSRVKHFHQVTDSYCKHRSEKMQVPCLGQTKLKVEPHIYILSTLIT